MADTVFGMAWSKSVRAWFFQACTSKSSSKLEHVCLLLNLFCLTLYRMNHVGFADQSSCGSFEFYWNMHGTWMFVEKYSDRDKKKNTAYELLINSLSRFVWERKFRFNNQSFVQLAVFFRPFPCKRWKEPRPTYHPTYFRQLKNEQKTVRKTECCVVLLSVPP
jgi:hypothetical protein